MANQAGRASAPSYSHDIGSHRHVGERGVNFLVVTLCLTLAAGVTLFSTGLALREPGIAAPISTRPADLNEELVREFYVAVSDAITTGDVDALDMIVAPDIIWCFPCAGYSPNLEGLKRYLTSLHRSSPDARLTVESVVAGLGDTVTAQIRVAGFLLLDSPIPWGPVDTLRIDGGVIAGRYATSDSITLIEPLLRARLDALPPAATGVTMARLLFPLDSGADGLLSAGPTLMVVESGTLAVRVAGGGRILRANGDETTLAVSENSSILYQGDATIIPPGARHALHQEGPTPAMAVGVTLTFDGGGLDRSGQEGSQNPPFLSSDESNSAPTNLPTVQYLASCPMDELPTGPVSIALRRAVLASGAQVNPPTGESMLLAVEAGTLGVFGSEDLTVAAGSGLTIPAESANEFRNSGNGLVALLILTVAPIVG